MKRRQNVKIIILLFSVAAVFVVLNFSGFSKNIKDFFYVLSAPLQKALWGAGQNVSGFFGQIAETKNLQKELSEANLKNQELLGQIIVLEEFKKENDLLRKAMDLGLEKEFDLAFCQVISKDVSGDSILINKGKAESFSEGMPVITEQKILLGRIGKVYQNFSEVILVSNKKSSFDAQVREKEIYGVIKGKGGFESSFDLVAKDKELSQGDLIITSVLGGVFPKGLLVGEVQQVNKSDVEQFQSAEIRPGFDLKNLDYLFVITNF